MNSSTKDSGLWNTKYYGKPITLWETNFCKTKKNGNILSWKSKYYGTRKYYGTKYYGKQLLWKPKYYGTRNDCGAKYYYKALWPKPLYVAFNTRQFGYQAWKASLARKITHQVHKDCWNKCYGKHLLSMGNIYYRTWTEAKTQNRWCYFKEHLQFSPLGK